MDTTSMNFSNMDYMKSSYQDEKDSGYTELNLNMSKMSFSGFNADTPTNSEMETENDFSIIEEDEERFPQDCEDDASDFYPSDPEDYPYVSEKVNIEEKRKKYQSRGLKIFKDLTENMSAPWKDELDGNNAFLSNMYKFNDEKKRWVKKGPVAIFILSKQFRLVTYNLYGQQTPSLNIKLWEFMSKFYRINNNMILLNSFGRNFKNKVLINTSVAYLKDIIDTSRLSEQEFNLIQNEKVNICNSTVLPYPEEDASKIIFSFKETGELARFKEAFDKVCNDLFVYNCQKRYSTFCSEQPVLTHQDHPTDKLSKYPYMNNDLFVALAKCGFEYKPIEDETGKLLNDRVVCSFCGATYAGWFINCESILTVHKEHRNAIAYKCPFVYQ